MTDFNPDFREWPKTPRLFREIVITEKIDGTNAGLHISEDGQVVAQSRKRIITPDSDNYGFARWAADNAADLAHILGPGLHFGEWWGQGIQRRYGLEEKRFSLFNTARWWAVDEETSGSMNSRAEQTGLVGQVDAVPVLYEGPFSEEQITSALRDLKTDGSYAAPGFMNPEGICVYHSQTRSVFKVTLDANDAGKWEVTA
ncbi:RNA ligase family protein [Streptomyces sp. IBSNAI001]|uniref:RNA ligase family protein n=1 Tax=Streptomyces sp. IBSNAI001 TaxID=3457499 RepID=UPI003FD1EDDE